MKLSRIRFRTLALASALSLLGCGSSGGSQLQPAFDPEITTHFADDVVVPTYQLLATRLGELDTAIQAFDADRTDAKLTAARDAWLAARVPWEQSEAFLFGPVESYGYDAAIDSWPVNRSDLQAVLDSSDQFTPSYVHNLQETQKGFHTVEYLLFDKGGTKTAADFDQRQFDYMKAISSEVKGIGAALANTWTQPVDGHPPYRDVLATAGQQGNTAYPSVEAAAQEMVGGMIGILDEVANSKIADPYDAKDPELVESQFAYTSLTDFANNIRSVQNGYLGHLPDAQARGRSLSDLVHSEKPEVDTLIRQELEDAITALGQIPEPFRDSIRNPDAAPKIEAAQAAVRKAQATFEKEIKPLTSR